MLSNQLEVQLTTLNVLLPFWEVAQTDHLWLEYKKIQELF